MTRLNGGFIAIGVSPRKYLLHQPVSITTQDLINLATVDVYIIGCSDSAQLHDHGVFTHVA